LPDAGDGLFSLEDLKFSPTAALFEGHRLADVDLSFFFTRTPPGATVGLHVHPYHEVFVLLEGEAVYTRGDERIPAGPDTVIVIPPETPHGFENVGDAPLVQLGIHERGTMQQTWLDD
jgi:mannose-6-phosphate isomerase-like protein (cupin superfamily)